MDEGNMIDLELSFLQNAHQGIESSINMLLGDRFSSLNELKNYFNEVCPSNMCTASYDNNGILISCLECRKCTNSCICLDCYFNGNHLGHDIRVSCINASGNCDCGDTTFWNESGFCIKHKIPPTDPDDLIDENYKQILHRIFRAATRNLITIALRKQEDYQVIMDFLQIFIEMGNGVRRILVKELQPLFDNPLFPQTFILMNYKQSSILSEFISHLVNDNYFIYYFSKIILNSTPLLISNVIDPQNKSIAVRNNESALFHFYDRAILKNLFAEGFDLYTIFLSSLSLLFEVQCKTMSLEKYKERCIFNFQGFLHNILRIIIEYKKSDPRTKQLVLFTLQTIRPLNKMLVFTRETGPKQNGADESYVALHHISQSFYSYIKCESKMTDYSDLFKYALQVVLEDSETLYPSKSPYNGAKVVPVPIYEQFLYCVMYRWGFDIFNITCQNLNLDVDETCIKAVLKPLRLHASIEMTLIRVFVRNRDDLLSYLSSFTYLRNTKLRYIAIHGFIQAMASIIKDKSKFVQLLYDIYGCKDSNETPELLFIFVRMLGSLALDDSSMRHDSNRYTELLAIQTLKESTKNIKDLMDHSGIIHLDNFFVNELSKFATATKKPEGGSIYRLKDGVKWSPFTPFSKAPSILKQMALHHDRFPTEPLSLPDCDRNKDLTSLLTNRSFFSIASEILHLAFDDEKFKASAILLLPLLIASAEAEPYDESKRNIEREPYQITKSFLSDLQIDNITDFLFTKIITPLHEMSNYEIIMNFEEGKNVLKKIGVHFEELTGNSSATSNESEKRDRIKRMKAQVQANFEQKMKEFADKCCEEAGEVESDVCVICQVETPDILHYQVQPYFAVDADPGSGIDFNAVRYVSCPHRVHKKCVQGSRCPIDRLVRSCYVPCYSLKDLNTDPNLAVDFVDKVFPHKVTGLDLVNSIESEIVAIEVLQRSSPDYLNRVNAGFLQALFVNYNLYTRSKNLAASMERPLQKFIWALLNSEEPFEVLEKVKTEKVTEEDYDRLVFYRRVAIIEHFLLGKSLFQQDSLLIDWDNILGSTFLCQHYQVDLKQISLNQFKFIPLPDNFLSLGVKPYDIKFQSKEPVGLVLTTGDLVSFHNALPKFPPVWQYLRGIPGYTAPVLIVGGPGITRVMMYSVIKRNGTPMEPLYTNALGEEDPGFILELPVFLRKEALNHLIEIYLSGTWLDILNSSRE